MKLEVWMQETNGPLVYEDVLATYTKGPLFCIKVKDGVYDKYPLCNIYKVRELTEGGSHQDTE